MLRFNEFMSLLNTISKDNHRVLQLIALSL